MSVTARQAFSETFQRLRLLGSCAPEREARELMRHACGLSAREFLLLDFTTELDPGAEARLEVLVTRREAHEPLQYVLGTVPFCGLDLEVGPGVLIPRPETEVLVERLAFWLSRQPGPSGRATSEGPEGEGRREGQGEPESGGPDAPWILDVGTGTGAIVLALVERLSGWRGIGIDLSSEALAFARRNLIRTGTRSVRFVQGDALEWVGTRFPGENLRLIVANPPYIPSGEIAGLAPEVRDHEPRGALDGGPDGLVLVRRIAERAAEILPSGGLLAFELAWNQSRAVAALLQALGFEVLERWRDLADRSRGVIARRVL